MVRPQASDISTDHLRSGHDDPKQARITLLQALEHLRDLLEVLGDASEYNVGVSGGHLASLGQGGVFDIAHFPLALQSQAEEGTDTATLMTPLLVAQAIAASVSTTRLSERFHIFESNGTYTPSAGAKDALVFLMGAGQGGNNGSAGNDTTLTSNANPAHHNMLRANGGKSTGNTQSTIRASNTVYIVERGMIGGLDYLTAAAYRRGEQGDLVISVIDVSSGNTSQVGIGRGGSKNGRNAYSGKSGKAVIIDS